MYLVIDVTRAELLMLQNYLNAGRCKRSSTHFLRILSFKKTKDVIFV